MTIDYAKYSQLHFVFIVNTIGPFGGAERQAYLLAQYIKNKVSDKVTFIAFEDGVYFRNKLETEQFNIIVTPFKHHEKNRLKKTYAYLRLIKEFRKIKPDILIPYVSESNKIVAQIWKHTGAHFAFWNQRDEGRKLYNTQREKKLIRNIPSIVSNSFEGRDALVNVYGLNPEEITVINNGIIPFNNNIQFTDWHKKLNIAENRPLISMIANITDRKDHVTLLKAWHLVIKHCKLENVELPFLVLAGRKDSMYDQLRLLAFDLKLCDHIEFIGTLNPVQPLIKESYFCVFSSNLEGCPNGVLECMEQGKAVIGTNISGVRQALGEKYSSHTLTKPNSEKDLAQKVITLLQANAHVEEIGLYNKNRISDHFNVKKMADSYLSLIKLKN